MHTPPAVIYPSLGCIDVCRKGNRVDTIGGRRDGDKEEDTRQRCAASTEKCSVR